MKKGTRRDRSPDKTAAAGKYCYDYPRPAVSVDLVVTRLMKTGIGKAQREVLLIRRAREPYAGCWALPGGFLDQGETLEQAAARELREETGVVARKLVPLGAFSRVDRDPRGRVISFVFFAEVPAATRHLAGDDAAAADWFPIRRQPVLAFDHAEMIAAARRRISAQGQG